MGVHISKNSLGRYFERNLLLAQSVPCNSPLVSSVLKEYRLPRFENRCQNPKCNQIFSALTSRKKYCSVQCRNVAGFDRFTAKRKGRKKSVHEVDEYKRQWNEFYAADMFGREDVPPPKLKGRPSLAQKTAIVEYELLARKRRRIQQRKDPPND